MENKENEILKRALAQFENLTGHAIKVKTEYRTAKLKYPATVIEIPDLKLTLYAEVKPNITNQNLGVVAYQVKEIIDEKNIILILVAHYITPQIADKLKAMNIQFLDTAGNAYINVPKILLYIKGNKVLENIDREKPVRAFQPAGLQLIYALLCLPGLENRPYRTMANAADIALGAVTWVIKDLIKLGYLIDMGNRGRRLNKKNELLLRWVNLYAELLRPRLVIGRYRTEKKDWWEYENIPNLKGQYGGETAAAIITKYLKPENHIIYTEENNGKLLHQLRLKIDPKGNIELLRKFWNFNDDWNKRDLVNPILIYADLLATGDERNLETAKMIYDKEIVRYIGED